MNANWLCLSFTILQITNKIPDVSQLRIRNAFSYFSIYINGCQQYPGCVPTVPTTRANISFCPSFDFTIKSIGSVASVANEGAKIANKIFGISLDLSRAGL